MKGEGYALLHNMVFMLVYLTEISIIMSDGQKWHWSKLVSQFKPKKINVRDD